MSRRSRIEIERIDQASRPGIGRHLVTDADAYQRWLASVGDHGDVLQRDASFVARQRVGDGLLDFRPGFQAVRREQEAAQAGTEGWATDPLPRFGQQDR